MVDCSSCWRTVLAGWNVAMASVGRSRAASAPSAEELARCRRTAKVLREGALVAEDERGCTVAALRLIRASGQAGTHVGQDRDRVASGHAGSHGADARADRAHHVVGGHRPVE